MEINKDTVIDVGMKLSNNFLLEHVSAGAYHPVLGEWIPKFTSALRPNFQSQMYSFNTANLPLWKVVKNLQVGSENVLENLLNVFGSDLNMRAGFINNVNPESLLREGSHQLGLSFDVQIKGYEDNMYTVAKELQQAAFKASKMELVFSNDSWLHLDIDPNRALANPLKTDLPNIVTVDSVSGIVEDGITSIRGFV